MSERSERPEEQRVADELRAWFVRSKAIVNPGVMAGMLLSAAAELLVEHTERDHVPEGREILLEMASRAWARWHAAWKRSQSRLS